MPGAKRKVDEDTWIVTQSKKFKCGQLLANVYATTLAQLRLGARNFFQDSNNGGKGIGTPPSSPFHSPPASPLVRDILNDEFQDLPTPKPRDVCINCSSKKEGWEKCYYCEKTICHANVCEGCREGYCHSCCITKYENPTEETYSCYGCLH